MRFVTVGLGGCAGVSLSVGNFLGQHGVSDVRPTLVSLRRGPVCQLLKPSKPLNLAEMRVLGLAVLRTLKLHCTLKFVSRAVTVGAQYGARVCGLVQL